MQTNVCQGVFAGGEIEPGVFHDVERPAPGTATATGSDRTEEPESDQDDSYSESPAESE